MPASVDMGKIMKHVIVRVTLTGVRRATMRVKLGLLFIRFGVWITGMSLTVDDER